MSMLIPVLQPQWCHNTQAWALRGLRTSELWILNMPGQSNEEELTITDELNQLYINRQRLFDRRNVLALLINFKRNNGQNEQR